MASNLAGVFGTPGLNQFLGSPTTGVIGNINDGNPATYQGYSWGVSITEYGVRSPWNGQWFIQLDMPRYIESVEALWNYSVVGDSYLQYSLVGIGYLKNGLYVNVSNPVVFEGENDNTIYIGEVVEAIIFTFYFVFNHTNVRTGSCELNMKELLVIGNGMEDSPIKIETLYGSVTLKQEEDLIGSLRFINGSGVIKSLQLCPTNNPNASPVRIMTASGIKSIAK